VFAPQAAPLSKQEPGAHTTTKQQQHTQNQRRSTKLASFACILADLPPGVQKLPATNMSDAAIAQLKQQQDAAQAGMAGQAEAGQKAQ
jgi:hypothetical protein